MKEHYSEEDELLDALNLMGKNRAKNCLNCIHKGKDVGPYWGCPAFPEGIPLPIELGEVVHDKPMFQQKNKIAFEVK